MLTAAAPLLIAGTSTKERSLTPARPRDWYGTNEVGCRFLPSLVQGAGMPEPQAGRSRSNPSCRPLTSGDASVLVVGLFL
jgi:hypothetical protein